MAVDATPVLWADLGKAVEAHHKYLRHPDPSKPDPIVAYRQAAFEGQIPWDTYTGHANAFDIGVLVADMAAHATTTAELATVLTSLDRMGAKPRWWFEQTGTAGDVLLARARGDAGTLSLPDGWVDVAKVASSYAPGRSGGYWANAMLGVQGVRPAAPKGLDL